MEEVVVIFFVVLFEIFVWCVYIRFVVDCYGVEI